MADSVRVTVKGLSELTKALEELPKQQAKNIIRADLKAAAGIWREEMKNEVAQGWHDFYGTGGRTREWGFLHEHIGMKTEVRGDELRGSCEVGPVRKGFWSLFLEFGTSRMQAHPFIRPTFEARKTEVLEKFVSACKEKLRRIGLR